MATETEETGEQHDYNDQELLFIAEMLDQGNDIEGVIREQAEKCGLDADSFSDWDACAKTIIKIRS